MRPKPGSCKSVWIQGPRDSGGQLDQTQKQIGDFGLCSALCWLPRNTSRELDQKQEQIGSEGMLITDAGIADAT